MVKNTILNLWNIMLESSTLQKFMKKISFKMVKIRKIIEFLDKKYLSDLRADYIHYYWIP